TPPGSPPGAHNRDRDTGHIRIPAPVPRSGRDFQNVRARRQAVIPDFPFVGLYPRPVPTPHPVPKANLFLPAESQRGISHHDIVVVIIDSNWVIRLEALPGIGHVEDLRRDWVKFLIATKGEMMRKTAAGSNPDRSIRIGIKRIGVRIIPNEP